ncbi:MAG: B12-binding domain-containing radical SAM protein [Ectothiorhodospiraceae bacterium]|nr:B12-binding domain-containing radical SAM protein [Ectothiorhodospiraceae bacterium]
MTSVDLAPPVAARPATDAPLRLALISPKGPLYRHRGGIFKRSLRYAPLTLTTLAALIPPDVPVRLTLHDEGIEDIPADLDADLVAMTVITGTAPRAYALAREQRARGATVVLGGPHVTLLPDEAARHADAIVTGYAEETWPELLRDFRAGRLRRRYDQSPELRLDAPVFPRRDLVDRRHYLTTDVFEATRTCAHDCEFCVAPAAWGRRQLQKPVEHVVEDIRRTGARRAIFIDLNLVSDRAHAERLFAALVPLRIRWFGLATLLATRDPELLDLMARSGCRGLLIGFESISRANLRRARKGFHDPDEYADAVARLHRRRISVMGCFVFGLDDDGPEVFAETARFVIDARIDLPRFAVATPFPGTPFHARLEREGRILSRDWERYDGQHVVFQPARMSVEALERGHEWAWRRVYRLDAIARRIAGSRVQIPLSIASNLGYRFYARHLRDFYNCDWHTGPALARRPG